MNTFDLIVVGAGPAGSAAAIAGSNRGLTVLLLEAGRYPRHKVCGEFVSAESAEVLRYLLADDSGRLFAAPRIGTAVVHSHGRSCAFDLASPGYSIPRIALDNALWQAAQARGVQCRIDLVTEVRRENGGLVARGNSNEYRARTVVNASGRWSRLSRKHSSTAAWIGLKAHFAGETNDSVDLYFLPNGYCGVQAVAPGVLNACALVLQGTARDLQDVFAQDVELLERARKWSRVTEVFATAPVYLGAGVPVIDEVLHVGDAAGFVDPFVGDGISLALRSGVLAGRCAGEVSPEAYANLYREAFDSIFRNAQRIRRLQKFPAFLHPLIIRGLGVQPLARHLFHQTRQAGFDVLNVPVEELSSCR